MGRHTIINPATGRSILKTGTLGRLVEKMQKQMNAKSSAKPPKSHKTKKIKKTLPKKKSYHATKCASPFKKRTKQGGTRPSARANYDMGKMGPVYYDGKVHVMAFRCNGSPYYKPKPKSKSKPKSQ